MTGCGRGSRMPTPFLFMARCLRGSEVLFLGITEDLYNYLIVI